MESSHQLPDSLAVPYQPLLLFDGVCNLCNHTVQILLKIDTKGVLKFASLQSPLGKAILNSTNLELEGVDSVVLVYQGRIYIYSSAIVKLGEIVGGKWKVMKILKLIPPRLLDVMYRWIARNRYRVFGKQESCMIPTPELRTRFIE